jgi:hypothetical protein
VLPYQEVGSALAQLEEPPGNAEVAVSDPEVPWCALIEHFVQQRTLLSVGVLARHGVDDQSEVEVFSQQLPSDLKRRMKKSRGHAPSFMWSLTCCGIWSIGLGVLR